MCSAQRGVPRTACQRRHGDNIQGRCWNASQSVRNLRAASLRRWEETDYPVQDSRLVSLLDVVLGLLHVCNSALLMVHQWGNVLLSFGVLLTYHLMSSCV